MKTLAITLCMLLVVLPVSAQEIAAARSPNFYVPYGVRDVPVQIVALESSSDAVRVAEAPQPGGVPPMPRPYPTRRGRRRPHGSGYGASPHLSVPATGAVIGALFALGLACFALVAGDN
ncbi:MAG TPA: hypothetical protein VGU25_05835 [Acidobacteriaceae bacterium]|nr:hypothetical protein [Acidobacteriaceae bacterium]